MAFITELSAKFIQHSNDIILTSNLVYRSQEYNRVFNVPEGFRTDCASIPKVFWSIVGHPFLNGIRNGAVLHDYLYKTHTTTKKEADKIFYEAMRSQNLNIVKALIIYKAVSMFGFFAYKQKGTSKYAN